MICSGCKCKLRWWQRKGGNTSWHRRCWKSWQAGYKTFLDFTENECMIAHVPTSLDLYWKRMKGYQGVKL